MPGEITSALSAGTNALLRLGAAPVTRARDVLELYGIDVDATPKASLLGPDAESVHARLLDASLTADELVRASELEPGAVAAALIELELVGRVLLEDGVYRARV